MTVIIKIDSRANQATVKNQNLKLTSIYIKPLKIKNQQRAFGKSTKKSYQVEHRTHPSSE